MVKVAAHGLDPPTRTLWKKLGITRSRDMASATRAADTTAALQRGEGAGEDDECHDRIPRFAHQPTAHGRQGVAGVRLQLTRRKDALEAKGGDRIHHCQQGRRSPTPLCRGYWLDRRSPR